MPRPVFFATVSRRSLGALAFGVLLGIAGCGGQSSADELTGGRSGGGNPGLGGEGGAGARGGNPAGGNLAGGAPAGGAACAHLSDESGVSLSIVISNQTSRTIHLGQEMVTCGVSPLFQVQDAAGTVLPLVNGYACGTSCSAALQGNPVGCPAICLYPSALTLAPGEGTSVSWDGLYGVEDRFTPGCVPVPHYVAGQPCGRSVRIRPGEFKFVAQAGTRLDCMSTDGTCAACMTSSIGGCITPAAVIAGSRMQAETTLVLDASYGVVESTSASSAAPIGALNPIEIVFKD